MSRNEKMSPCPKCCPNGRANFVRGFSADEKAKLYHDNAARVYRL